MKDFDALNKICAKSELGSAFKNEQKRYFVHIQVRISRNPDVRELFCELDLNSAHQNTSDEYSPVSVLKIRRPV